MEVRWKVLLGAVAVGAVVTAVLLLVAPEPAKPAAPPAPSVDSAAAAARGASAPSSAAASLASADQRLPGTWVDQTPPDALPNGPLVIGLHGRGDSPERFSAIAARLGPRFAWRFLKAPLAWRENTQWFRNDASDGGRQDVLDTLALIDAHVRQARGRKVAIVGFSQGCMVAAHYAAAHPSSIAAVICAGGALVFPPSEVPAGAKPAMVFVHGTEDPIVPLSRAREARQQLENRGLPSEFVEHAEGHSLPEAEMPRLREWLERQLGPNVAPRPPTPAR